MRSIHELDAAIVEHHMPVTGRDVDMAVDDFVAGVGGARFQRRDAANKRSQVAARVRAHMLHDENRRGEIRR